MNKWVTLSNYRNANRKRPKRTGQVSNNNEKVVYEYEKLMRQVHVYQISLRDVSENDPNRTCINLV